MRNYETETQKRIEFIRRVLLDAHADGVVFGNSGGKDSALVGILCKMACPKVYGIAMPCASSRNFGEDMADAKALAEKFDISLETIDLTGVRESLCAQIAPLQQLNAPSTGNIAPRLRMTTLYAIAQSRNCLVAGTGNKCERHMGYFTKFGDGGCDFNPIADLLVSEIYEFLEFLGAPQNIIAKAPSAGLFEGQTDEAEMGVTYAQIEAHIQGTQTNEKIARAYTTSDHKRTMPRTME